MWETLRFDYPDIPTKYNPFHHPAGAPGSIGGQFAPADGRGGGSGVVTSRDFDAIPNLLLADYDGKLEERWNDLIGEKPGPFIKSLTEGIDDEEASTTIISGSENIFGDDQYEYLEIATAGNYHNYSFHIYKDENGNKVVTEPSIIVDQKAKQGLVAMGRRLLRNSFDAFQRINVRRAEFIATLNMGGYAWAKYGCVPDRAEWNELRGDIKRYNLPKLDHTTSMIARKILDNPNPKAIWVLADMRGTGKRLLAGSSWKGSLDITDTQAMRRFRRYVGA